jgi:hypothetical protein
VQQARRGAFTTDVSAYPPIPVFNSPEGERERQQTERLDKELERTLNGICRGCWSVVQRAFAGGFRYGIRDDGFSAWHKPGTGIAIGINKGVWERFDDGDRQLIEAVAAAEYARSLAESDLNNALALRKLRTEGGIKISKFDDSVLKAVLGISKDVVADLGTRDELSRKIYASYQQFRTLIADWNAVSARDYLSSRGSA